MDIDKLRVDGRPDDFYIKYANKKIGRCWFRKNNAFPFVIANGKLYLGDEGEDHSSVICDIIGMSTSEFQNRLNDATRNDDREEMKRLGDLWKKGLMTMFTCKGNTDYVDGRIFLKISESSPNMPFDYAVLSLWGSKNGKPKNVDGNIINELLGRFNVNPDKLLIACFDNKNYGKVIPYKKWAFYVPEMDDKQKQDYALHLMNAKDKHNATSDFRDTRDRAIYVPREKAAGTLAAYHAMKHPFGEGRSPRKVFLKENQMHRIIIHLKEKYCR